MEEEFDTVLKKIKNRNTAALDKIPHKVWKTKKFDHILFRLCNAVSKQNSIKK